MLNKTFALGLVTLLFSPVAVGQWDAVNLHPTGAVSSRATGTANGKQVGVVSVNGIDRASIWSGTKDSWTALNQSGLGYSSAWDAGGGLQVGNVPLGTFQHAAIWSGDSGNWVDLTPAHATGYTSAYGTDGVQQVGVTMAGNQHRASLWSGTSASWIDLSGDRYSDAFDVHDGQQVGSVNLATGPNACLWTGTAASWVNLHPTGNFFRSSARGVYGGRQVGTAVDTNNRTHGGIWAGTADSWIDLTPAGADQSEVEDIFESRQVGSASLFGAKRACLWEGSAESWVDLHAFLPSEFSGSFANAIVRNGDQWTIVGYGFNQDTQRDEALMWVSTVPEPGGALVTLGALLAHRHSKRNRQRTGNRTQV